jgi:toluene monooxygenase system protein E
MPKTYSHLLSARRVPTDYELVSSGLRYASQLSNVRTPARDFQARYPLSLSCSRWDAFCDPRETTYSTYVSERRDQENYLERVIASHADRDYEAELDAEWIALLERAFVPLRYPCHGLHMLSAYVAQAAPSGRISIAAAFQTGDELRRVQRIAYRTKQLMNAHPGFGEDAQARWEREPALQPLRETIERMLVSYEWGEAFVGLNLVLKPLFDEYTCRQFATFARGRRDDLLARVLLSLHDDQRWHRAWAGALVQHVLADAPENIARLLELIAKWRPGVRQAISAMSELLSPVHGDAAQLVAACENEHGQFLEACGLELQTGADWRTKPGDAA